MKIVSLCTGYGGLDRAVEQVIPGARTVLVSDIDKGASKILAHRYPHAPNIGDFTTYDWTGVECDVLTAGFPCQPVSNAGKRKGTTDDRWLFDDILAAIGRMAASPRLLVFENVLGLLTANGGDAMARVVEGLASVGYVGRYRVLRASDVGAPHRRERVFVVASPADAGGEHGIEWWQPAPGQAQGGRALGELARRDRAPVALLPTPAVNDDMGEGKTVEAWDEWTAKMRAKHGNGNGHGASLAIEAQRLLPTQVVADANGARNATSGRREGSEHHAGTTLGDVAHADQWGDYAAAIARWESLTRPAPAPTEPTGKGGAHRLSPRFCEWLMGLPDGWITDTPGITRNEALKAAGNGVVVHQAAAAVSYLLEAR